MKKHRTAAECLAMGRMHPRSVEYRHYNRRLTAPDRDELTKAFPQFTQQFNDIYTCHEWLIKAIKLVGGKRKFKFQRSPRIPVKLSFVDKLCVLHPLLAKKAMAYIDDEPRPTKDELMEYLGLNP